MSSWTVWATFLSWALEGIELVPVRYGMVQIDEIIAKSLALVHETETNVLVSSAEVLS